MGVFKRLGEWLKKLRNKREPEPVIKVIKDELLRNHLVYQIYPRGNVKILRKVKLYPAIRQTFQSAPGDLRFRHQRQVLATDEGWYIVSRKEGGEIIPLGKFIIADDPYDAIAQL